MRKIFLTFVLAGVAVAAFSQTEIQTKRGPYLTNRFFDNWFLGAGGGVNMYVGSADAEADLGKRLAPAVTAELGKWITPSVGLRVGYWGLSAKGASVGYAPYSNANTLKDGYAEEEFDFLNIHADVMWNLSSAIGGYKENRFWEFVPFGGFGFAQSSKNGRKDEDYAVTAGLVNKLRLSPAWNINWEINGLLVQNSFDGVQGDTKLEGMLGTTIGIAYNFNRRGFNRQLIYEKPDYAPYNNRISALEGDLSAAQARARQLADELAAARNRPAPAPQTKVVMPQAAIFFPIGSSVLSEKELVNIDYLAKALKESGNNITVTGHADSATGSAKYNQTLSQKRADAVKAALVKAGVDASKITANGKGGDDPINKAKPILNRVVITQ